MQTSVELMMPINIFQIGIRSMILVSDPPRMNLSDADDRLWSLDASSMGTAGLSSVINCLWVLSLWKPGPFVAKIIRSNQCVRRQSKRSQ